MNYLLTGANGFLGKAIVNVLATNKNTIASLSRTCGDYTISLEKEVPIFKQKFETVIHAAGKAHCLPKTDAEILNFHEVNVAGTENLLKGLEKAGVPKQFIFISSVAVYGQNSGINITEAHPLLATDAYGLSKVKAEELIVNWCKKNEVLCTILRLPLVVGVNPPGNLGAMLHAIEKGYYFNINGGIARKSMVLAADVAQLIPNLEGVSGIFNLTDGFHPSFKDLSSQMAFHKNKKEPFNIHLNIAVFLGYLGDFLGDKFPINSLKVKKITSDLIFDDSKARLTFKWNPRPVLKNL
jgi:nucleoside-diphosphate-sugar epimerase